MAASCSVRNVSDVANQDLSSINPPHEQENEASSKKQHPLLERRIALEHDVAKLQKCLMNEQAIRHTLEQAMDRTSSDISSASGHEHLTTQTKELIHDIIYLEEEVLGLERRLLTLYRQFFSRCLSTLSQPKQRKDPPVSLHENEGQHKHQRKLRSDEAAKPMKTKQSPGPCCKVSTTSQRTTTSVVASSNSRRSSEILNDVRNIKVHSYSLNSEGTRHAQSRGTLNKVLTERFTKSNPSSLNEDRPRSFREHLGYTPNRLSEELIRSMAAIYCKLADPPLPNLAVAESPSSSCTTFSSTSASSVHGICSDGWSPGCKTANQYDAPLVDPFQVKGNAGGIGAYSFMLEVPWICVDKDRLGNVSRMLRDYRSMVEQLEKIDPSQLKHNEKLAFWINIYNALLMHAYLAYGIPRNNMKRMALLQRASYNVGGHSINAHVIEHFILGCRSHRSTKWLQNLLLPGSKFKVNDEKRSYAVSNPEPLVCFALCCGGQSDPAVRVYTAKNIHKELEDARKEFLQASIGFQNDKKVLLPKILEWYAKEASIQSNNLLKWISQYLTERDRDTLSRYMQSKSHKSVTLCIEWMPYNFNFRYIFERELVVRSFVCLDHREACATKDDNLRRHQSHRTMHRAI